MCLPRVRFGLRWMAPPRREAAGGYRHVRPRGRRETRVRILVVEDEPTVARALQDGLAAEHYDVVVAHTGEDGFFYANAETFDVVVLDLRLPGRDGLAVLSTLRKRGLQTPVLILTAKDAVEDRVLGVGRGGGGYPV